MDRMRAIITGAAAGIGYNIACRFLELGWDVTGIDIDEELLHKSRRYPSGESKFYPVVFDLSRSEALIEMIKYLPDHDDPLHLLVNNAAVTNPIMPHLKVLEVWENTLAVNLTAPYLLTFHLEKHLRMGKGCVVNIASTRAIMSEPHTEAYSASKGGLVALTHAMAISLSPDVRVNCISPGWIDSRDPEDIKLSPLTQADHLQHPVGRAGHPEDITSLVEWLTDQRQGFVTGSNFVVDGGMTRKMIYE